MAVSTNTFVAYGRLVADAQPIAWKDGGCRFRIAIDGYKKEETLFITCSKWGSSGQSILGFLKKGKEVIVTGALKPVKYKNKTTGADVDSIEVTCSAVQLVGGAPTEMDAPNTDKDPFDAAVASSNSGMDEMFDDTDIPF